MVARAMVAGGAAAREAAGEAVVGLGGGGMGVLWMVMHAISPEIARDDGWLVMRAVALARPISANLCQSLPISALG